LLRGLDVVTHCIARQSYQFATIRQNALRQDATQFGRKVDASAKLTIGRSVSGDYGYDALGIHEDDPPGPTTATLITLWAPSSVFFLQRTSIASS